MSPGRSRSPSLTSRGCYLLALGLVLLIVGVGYGSWGLAAAGLAVITLLFAAFAEFAGRAALLWRRYLELVWWLPRAASSEGLLAQRPFVVELALRNLSPLDLGLAAVRVFSSRCVSVESGLELLPLRPRTQSLGKLTLRAAQAGQWTIHGAAVQLWDRLGIYTIEAYFPSMLGLKVLPRPQPRVAVLPSRVRGAAGEERIGAHTLRRRGMGGELRELREYVPGDPFKLIAWKASARAPFGRPLVRELEREMVLTHYLLLDIGASMRDGPPGQWKLDHAIELCLGYAATALGDGDRLGLIAFDATVYRHLKPGDGPPQRLQVCERLLEVMNVVDDGFVALTDGELVEAVARYLRQQEGLDATVRRPPPLEDQQAWAGLAVSPSRNLYSIAQLVEAARRLLPAAKPGALPAKNDLAVLRQLCRHLGIELPYAQRPAAERMVGLSTALELAAQTGGARLVLFSDLLGLGLEDEAPQFQRAVALCRRRGHQLLCVQTESGRYLPKPLPDADPIAAPSEQLATQSAGASASERIDHRAKSRVATIFSWEQERQEARMHRMLAKIGFHVIAVGPEDGLAQVFARPQNKPRARAPA